MILSYFYQSSGLGNQLFRIVATRVKALDLGVDWGMIYVPNDASKDKGFKGESFMDINWQVQEDKFLESNLGKPNGTIKYWNEKKVVENGVDIRGYDPEFNFIEDNTIIDGEFQDERYWEHQEKEVNEWLKVEPLEMPDDLCVISHRGGEFAVFPDLFLPTEYWNYAISEMRKINPNMKFQVQTDDVITAKKQFPEFEIIHDIGYNWRAIRYANYLIVGNSSFSILPSWLGKAKKIFAPKYHARHNTGVWCMNQNFYKKYTYIDRSQYASSI